MEREKSEKRIISEYIFRGLNFKAVNLVGLQKKTKGCAPFLVLEFKGKSVFLYDGIMHACSLYCFDHGNIFQITPRKSYDLVWLSS